MLCLTCKNLSLQIICKDCQNNLLIPSFHKREIEDGFFNYYIQRQDALDVLATGKVEIQAQYDPSKKLVSFVVKDSGPGFNTKNKRLIQRRS
mgnify:CR=1 FL=1